MKQRIESSLREATSALEALLRNPSALGAVERAAGILVKTFEGRDSPGGGVSPTECKNYTSRSCTFSLS